MCGNSFSSCMKCDSLTRCDRGKEKEAGVDRCIHKAKDLNRSLSGAVMSRDASLRLFCSGC